MQIQRRLKLCALLSSFLVLALPAVTVAQSTNYPQRPITFVVPNAAGGAADNLARSFAEELSRKLGQPILVENLGGASGALAAQKVLRANPDGYTLLFGTTSDMVVTPIANKAAGYASKDFTSIVKVGTTPMSLVARNNLGVSNAEQLVALAKQKPGTLSMGVTGNASLQAFAAVALQRAAKIDLIGVPYKGGAAAITDLMGGQIDLVISVLPGVLGQVRNGKVQMLGVLSEKRSPYAPELPTLGETPAFKGVTTEIWAGIAGPANMPEAVTDKISKAAKLVLEDTQYVQQRAKLGDSSVPYMTPAAFTRFVAEEDAKYRDLATGLKLE